MTSERLFVWTWLPNATEPIVAGVLEPGEIIGFAYGRSYLANPDAIALGPELPLEQGIQRPTGMATLAGCVRDAAPDSWGQRVILYRASKHTTSGRDTAELDMLTYLRESGSNRIGALDFQASSDEYVARGQIDTSLAELQAAADAIAAGEPLDDDLAVALLHGTSVGGARPKVTLTDSTTGIQQIAKFSLATDPYPIIKAEAAAMYLARAAGVGAATTTLTRVAGRDVLLVDRFDRNLHAHRRHMLSLLTLLELDEMEARHASYHAFAALIRQTFTDPVETLHELFRRIVVNVAVSNTDDHARNHAAFWDGQRSTLTPAYDICPQLRSGGYTEQAMAIGSDGRKASNFATCIDAAETFLLQPTQATDIVDETIDTINTTWKDATEAACLTGTEAELMWGNQILNPAVHHPSTS